jgi:hypothetical protein
VRIVISVRPDLIDLYAEKQAANSRFERGEKICRLPEDLKEFMKAVQSNLSILLD